MQVTSQYQPDLFSLLQTAKPQPLRLKFDYTALESSVSNLTAVQVDELQQRFGPATIAILAKFLQVGCLLVASDIQPIAGGDSSGS